MKTYKVLIVLAFLFSNWHDVRGDDNTRQQKSSKDEKSKILHRIKLHNAMDPTKPLTSEQRKLLRPVYVPIEVPSIVSSRAKFLA
jgi:hypothetical protein